MKLIFKKESRFIGRNGYFRSSGVDVSENLSGEIVIQPITSKGAVANCMICVPLENIPELVEKLTALSETTKQ